jgi:hypothetical protein
MMRPLPFLCLLSIALPAAAASVVSLEKNAAGKWTLLRDGRPFFIKGACGTEHLGQLRVAGANSLRTYGVNQLDAVDSQGRNPLDLAHEQGLAATVGIWLKQLRHGFDPETPAHFLPQREAVRAAVRKWKDHPALLLWGLGNEVELRRPRDNPALWNELNELARIVKEEDPAHPVMTVIAGAHPDSIRSIIANYPELDILGVNFYGSAASLPEKLRGLGWTKPWVLAEFGPRGWWGAGKTHWGAPLEPTAEAKARMYADNFSGLTRDATGQCLGAYAFIWGHKPEATATWFGLFLPTGERLPAIDALTRAWSGEWPANRCPEITALDAPAGRTLAPGATREISVSARDPENDALAVTWWVQAESAGADAKRNVGKEIPGLVAPANAARAVLTAPGKPGDYRLYVKVVDPRANASVRNAPFRVAR